MDDEIQHEPKVQNLWGEWVYAAPRKKGRPPFERTSENANKVSMLLACGWSNERIADCILDPRTGKSISTKTLQRYFSPELSERDKARDRQNARRLMRVWEQAEAGNVGAERLFSQLMDRNDSMEAERRLAKSGPKAKDAMGKKEQAKVTARDAEADLIAQLENEAAGHVKQ